MIIFKGTFKIAFFILSLILLSCSHETPSRDVFFGGEIANPQSKEIIISYASKALDTIRLDSENRFYSYIRNVKPGIYSFKNGSEYQSMFLEPGDSTVIYANSKRFDESLNFSGKGASKNNFLMEIYLLNEKNNSFILSSLEIEPSKYEVMVDSIMEIKRKKLRKLEEKHNFSDNFMEIANLSIDLEHYDMKERYTYLINMYNNEFISEFPKDFHDYRKNVDFNNPSLETHYGFLKFVDNYIKNRAIENCRKKGNSQNCTDLYSYNSIRRRLAIADSITNSKEVKSIQFQKLGAQAILSSTTESQLDSVIKLLTNENISEDKLRNLKILAAIQNVYLPGRKVPRVQLLSTSGDNYWLPGLVNKPTVFYNWSIYSNTHHQSQHKIIETLREKFPQINFIGLNIDAGDTEQWAATIKAHKYLENQEFQLYKIPIDTEYLKYFLDKLLFVDSKGTVIMGHVKLTAPGFEARIEHFLNPSKKDFSPVESGFSNNMSIKKQVKIKT